MVTQVQDTPSGAEQGADSQSALRDAQEAAKGMHSFSGPVTSGLSAAKDAAYLENASKLEDAYLRPFRIFALPNPNVHHRHKAMPVFLRKEKVARLDAPPTLFDPPKIVPTNSMTSEQFLTDRISRDLGYNVGPGPVWDIMKDRSCFKEALEGAIDESFRRPKIHQCVEVKPGWTRLNEW